MYSQPTSFFLSFAVLFRTLLFTQALLGGPELVKRPLDQVPIANPNEYLQAYRTASKRIIVLDDGGTLRQSDRDATNVEAPRILLKKLTAKDENIVWIDTARATKNAKDWYGEVPNLGLSGSLGSDPLLPGGGKIARFEEMHQSMEAIKKEVLGLPELYQDLEDPEKSEWKSVITRHLTTSIIIHYEDKKDKAQLPSVLKKINAILQREPFKDYTIDQPYANKEFYSIAHKDAHKGTLVKWLLEEHNADRKTFVLTIGDQDVDEEMHKVAASHDYYSITSSTKKEHQTYARNRLEGYPEVVQLLTSLADAS